MREFTEKHKKFIVGGGMILFLLLSVIVFVYAGKPLIRFISQPELFRAWVDEKGFFGRILFIGMVVLQVFIAIIPGEPFEIAAGYAFGAVEGTLLCMFATTLGGMLVFGFVRKFGVKAVEVFFPREKIRSLKFLQNSSRLNILVWIIFLIPGTPKDLLTYFVGLTEIKPFTWLMISIFARIPSIITSTIGGNALGMQDYVFAIVVFGVTLILSICGILIYQRICRHHEAKNLQKNPSSETDSTKL